MCSAVDRHLIVHFPKINIQRTQESRYQFIIGSQWGAMMPVVVIPSRERKKRLIRVFLSFRPATFSEAGELVIYASTPAEGNS